jgi:hypothetical protein
VSTIDNDLFTTYLTTGYVGEKWANHGEADPSTGAIINSILPGEVDQYTGWTVTASYIDYPAIVAFKQIQ